MIIKQFKLIVCDSRGIIAVGYYKGAIVICILSTTILTTLYIHLDAHPSNEPL